MYTLHTVLLRFASVLIAFFANVTHFEGFVLQRKSWDVLVVINS